MNRRIELPDKHQVRLVCDAMLTAATTAGTRPGVIDLARRLGLANTMFLASFPDIAREVSSCRTTRAPGSPGRPQLKPAAVPPGADILTVLRCENRLLNEQLEVAAAQIARLTLGNAALRRGLELARGVHSLYNR